MNKKTKEEIIRLAALMTDVDNDTLESYTGMRTVLSGIKKQYGITLGSFCKIVWDLLDYTPIAVNSYGERFHAFGPEIASTKCHRGMIAFVVKKAQE